MKRFGKSSSRNSNKSLSLKTSSCLSPGFDEGKQQYGGTQRSLSMEHINNHANTLGSTKITKTKDLKLNGGGIYDTMISSKMSSAELLSLSRKKKSASSVPTSPVPPPAYNNNTSAYNNNMAPSYNNNTSPPSYNNSPPSYNREYSVYSDSNVLKNHSSNNKNNNNNSSPKQASTPLGNIENTLYNGTVGTPHYTSAPGGDTTNELDRSEAEARLCKLRQELDRKRIFIKNMKMSLDTVDSSDNIDIRIQHAELEYQLGKEELNLLNILEEFRNLQTSIENNFKSEGYFHESLSIYNYMVKHCSPADTLTLHAVQVPYDSKSPKFGLSYRDENNGLYVEWTSESQPGSLGLCKGDRILEINNHLIVQNNNRTELIKLLKLLPQTKLVVLRTAPAQVLAPSPLAKDLAPPPSSTKPDEAEKIQNDNVRLTHRISYLEEQVAELLQKVNKGQTFHTTTKLSRTKNKYLETSLCSSKPYETKDYPNQRQLADDDEEIQVFQKGNKIKTLLKNQKYAKEKLDKVLEKTKKHEDIRDDSQRYSTDAQSVDDSAKENRQSLSRKYKTLEKCNPSKYHRRKKSETSLGVMNNSTNTLKSNLSDTETYIPKIKSKSLIYLNKSQSDYNYPLVSPLHGSEKSINNLSVSHDPLHEPLDRFSGDKLDAKIEEYDDERYRKTYTFPIVKYNSDKNVRKVIDAKIYEENGRGEDHGVNLVHQRLEYSSSLDRLAHRNSHCYDELNRKLGVCETDEKLLGDGNNNHPEENRLLIQTNIDREPMDPCDRLARLYVVNESNSKGTGDSRHINNFVSDSKEAFSYSNQGSGVEKLDGGSQNQHTPLQNYYHPHATSKISIEFMDKSPKFDSSRMKSDSANTAECYQKEPNNNELYRIEKAIFNELHEECINKLDKSPEQKRTEMEEDELATVNGAKDSEERDVYCSNQYDDFVRNKQSLDRIYDKYFHEADSQELGGALQDAKHDKHRYLSKKDLLKNKFKNEKYVDIDNDNEIPLSRNVEKLNNNFKEFWKIKSYKKNSLALNDSNEKKTSDGIEKSQSETNFNDYERKIGGYPPSIHEDSRKFNEHTRMSKYELDDKKEKEKLQTSFLNSHSRTKPVPPKKPARLSLQRAASLQSVNSVASVMTHNSDSQTKKPIKRSYRGDTSYLTTMSMQNTGNERWC